MTEPKPINNLSTASDVIRCIPDTWRKAEIMMQDQHGQFTKVARISLQSNSIGRRVVMIHATGTAPR